MNRADALGLLESGKVSERLAGARRLAAVASAGDQEAIRRAREREADWWVQRALDRALERARSARAPDVAASEEENELASDARAEAVQEVTGVLLHELNPLVGTVEIEAATDVPGYEGSGTCTAIRRVKEFLRAIELLRDAAAVPNESEIDLTEIVSEIVRTEGFAGKVELARADSVVVVGDAALIRLVVVNALRNAVEATEGVTDREAARPVLNWGVTDRDAWVAVIDDGVGLPEGTERLWAPGNSQKDKGVHNGFGLAIARQATESLGGNVELRARSGRGAVCELTWSQGL